MARRRYIGGDDNEDIAALLAARQQQQVDPRMAMAMQIMGLMEKQRTGAEDRALEERKQQAQEMYQSGQLADLAAKQKTSELEQKSLAEARTAERTGKIQEGMSAADREANRKAEEAAKLEADVAYKNQALASKTLDDLMQHGGLQRADPKTGKINPEYARLRGQIDPGFGEAMTQSEKNIFEENVAAGLAKYQQADPKTRKALAKDPNTLGGPEVYNEILKRANVNVAPPGAPVPAPGEGRLPLSSLNAPTAPPGDIFSEQGVRIGPPIVDARDYGKFPGSVEDLIRASGQPQPESRFAQPAPMAPAPAGPSNFYEEGYPSAKPDYMYGIQTPVAADVINKYANDPRFTPVEDELMAKLKGWWNQPRAVAPPVAASGWQQ